MNPERDHERVLAAQTARAQAEAQRILHSALEQAATLQAEMSQEVEAQTHRRMANAEREIAERMKLADEEAEERVRQSVDTAAALLLNAHKQADRIRAQLSDAMRAQTEALRGELPQAVEMPDPRIARAEQEAAARLAEAEALVVEAEALAAERIAEAKQWSRRHLAEADELGTRRILDAERQAQALMEHARTAALVTTLPDPPPSPPAGAIDLTDLTDRPPPPDRWHSGDGIAVIDDDPQDPPSPTSGNRTRRRVAVNAVRVVVVVVVAVVGATLARALVVEPYTVASTSMEPAFQDGDRLVVNKLAYRLGDAKRGDIVVFDPSRVPGAGNELGDTLVKRVIGLPGEVVRANGGQVLVNEEQMDEPWLGDVPTPDFGPVTVPEDALFVLGDARLTSVDSRAFGPVPTDAVRGRVEAVIWPPSDVGGV